MVVNSSDTKKPVAFTTGIFIYKNEYYQVIKLFMYLFIYLINTFEFNLVS